MMRLLLALPFILFSFAARAQSPQMPYVYPVTVGTSQVVAVPSNPSRRKIMFVNNSSTATISVCPAVSRSNSASITCTLNGPGSVTLIPNGYATFEGVGQNPLEPTAWNAVASASGSSLSVFEWE